tara:strand:+ start:194 stop:643 length:450 start_codon:yes stop_codon:yes gene_type:complete
MSAFDYAWSVLKALPEQQPFSQHVRPQKQFEQAGQTVDVRRFPTVHPAIMGLMSRTQGRHTKDIGDKPNMQVGGPYSTELGAKSPHAEGRIADIPTSSVVDDGDVTTIEQNPAPLFATRNPYQRGPNPEVRISSSSDFGVTPSAMRNVR